MSDTTGWTEDNEIDWDQVDTNGPKPLENGIYALEIDEAGAEKTKKGDPGIKLKLKAVEQVGVGELAMSRTVFDNIPVLPQTLWRVARLATCAGVEKPSSTGAEKIEEFCSNLLESNRVYARLMQNEYNGKINSKVASYLTEEEALEAAAHMSSGSNGSGEASSDEPRRRSATV